MDGAGAGDRVVHGARHRRDVGHVALRPARDVALGLDGFHQLAPVLAPRGDDDVRTRVGAGEGDAPTDTGTCPRDDDRPPREHRAGHGAITAPPSTSRVAPLMPRAPGLHKNSTAPATSATGSSRTRAGGGRNDVCPAWVGASKSSGTDTQLTEIPAPPHCRAADLASARTPSTASTNGTEPGAPLTPAVAVTTTTRPSPWDESTACAVCSEVSARHTTSSQPACQPAVSVATSGRVAAAGSGAQTCTTADGSAIAASAALACVASSVAGTAATVAGPRSNAATSAAPKPASPPMTTRVIGSISRAPPSRQHRTWFSLFGSLMRGS